MSAARNLRGPGRMKGVEPGTSKWTGLKRWGITLFGPLFLIYLNLRCEKNMCVLLHFPMNLPNYIGAYLSTTSFLMVFGFLAFMVLLRETVTKSSCPRTRWTQDTECWYPGIYALMASTLSVMAVAYLKPEFIHLAHEEHLRLLMATTIFCFGLSFFLALYQWTVKLEPKERDVAPSFFNSFFEGTLATYNVAQIELKYFFYVHVGLVAWATMDLMMLLDSALKRTVTAPLAFLAITQYLVIAHTLLYESYLSKKRFVENEKLGFFWLMKVLLYLPFFHSLPVYYLAVTEVSLPQPVMLADCVLFLFGFIVYTSSIHQKENFSGDRNVKSLKSIPVNTGTGKRMLISGYWGVVQKPDYLGYMIIWLSWIIACGLSGLSLVVLMVIYGTFVIWLQERAAYIQGRYTGWKRYTDMVPAKVLPFVY